MAVRGRHGVRGALARILPGLLAVTAAGCAAERPRQAEVVVYTSVDEPYARPIFDAFTSETGVIVRPVLDTEANKSRGLAQRILSEKGNPRADVFWSSEVMQMLALLEGGALEPYRSPSAEGIPARYRDPQDRWTGFAARFRVLLINTARTPKAPKSLLELTGSRWRGEVAMANPLFGSTTTEAAALFQVLGSARGRGYYAARKANDVRVMDGNGPAAEEAARGNVAVAQTDTDDAYIRLAGNPKLRVVFPDQEGIGALMIPNTAALVRGAPRAAQGKQLLDFLLRPETELLLANLPSRQLPLHEGLQHRRPEPVRPLAKVKAMAVDYSRLRGLYPEVDSVLRELFLR